MTALVNSNELSIFSTLDAAYETTKFEPLLRELTAMQLYKYMQHSNHDVVVYVWSYHVTWGFEANWAWESTLSEQEKEDFASSQNSSVDEIFDGIPDDFNPNIKLKDISLWAPQDQMVSL